MEKTWHDYLEKAYLLQSHGHCLEYSEVELAKKLFIINKSKGEVLPTHSPSKHNNTETE